MEKRLPQSLPPPLLLNLIFPCAGCDLTSCCMFSSEQPKLLPGRQLSGFRTRPWNVPIVGPENPTQRFNLNELLWISICNTRDLNSRAMQSPLEGTGVTKEPGTPSLLQVRLEQEMVPTNWCPKSSYLETRPPGLGEEQAVA